MDRNCVCGSSRFLNLWAKCCDSCSVELDGCKEFGYVPSKINMGTDGDYIRISVCADCGKLSGSWPLPINAHKQEDDEET